MKKIILILLLFTACTNESNNPPDDVTKDDQNRANDTKRDTPDTTMRTDTGSYDKMSDSLRKKY